MKEHFDDEYVKKAQKLGLRSRAYFKIEEINNKDKLIKPGMKVVDLGAAPGGWTYQFVKKGIHVIAIDNGPMQKELMSTGLVQHEKADGFRQCQADP